MIMQDHVKPKERTTFIEPLLVDYANHECISCGRTAEEIAETEGWTDEDFDNNSKRTLAGLWYCHTDCRR